uniref:Uncharacterized protein n=1 Tax=Arundo donax TaxID=35708 RepID=A0A0A9ABQ9_ARUDO
MLLLIVLSFFSLFCNKKERVLSYVLFQIAVREKPYMLYSFYSVETSGLDSYPSFTSRSIFRIDTR